MRYIELFPSNARPLLVAFDQIASVEFSMGWAVVSMKDGRQFELRDTYESIKSKVQMADWSE